MNKKIYKLTMYVVPLEDYPIQDLLGMMSDAVNGVATNTVVHTVDIQQKNLGEWYDDIPINKRGTDWNEYFKSLPE